MGPEETRANLRLVHMDQLHEGSPFTCEIVYWVSPNSATSETVRAWREREQVHNYYSKVSYSADMIYYSVNCLSSVTWVGENLVRNGAIWWNGIPVSCPIFSLWTSVCISTVVIRSIVDHFLYFVNVYPRLLCVLHENMPLKFAEKNSLSARRYLCIYMWFAMSLPFSPQEAF